MPAGRPTFVALFGRACLIPSISLSQTSMSLGHSAPPGSKFRIGHGVRLLRVAQRGLQVAMAKPLADGGEADASVDELRRVGMAQLVQGGVGAAGSTVPDPMLVRRLIAQ